MATLDMSCSDLVDDVPLITADAPRWDNRIGEYGASFPRGRVLWIDTDDVAHESGIISEDEINSTNNVTGAKAGSGEFGKAIFRNGLTYTITAGEETILDAAGYGDCIT